MRHLRGNAPGCARRSVVRQSRPASVVASGDRLAMRFGAWTPLPHTIRPEPLMSQAIAESSTRGLAAGPDKAFRFAVDMLQRAEELGFESTLIAERWMGTDHSAWLLASALAPLTSRIELMVAVHPGILTPQAVAKLAVSL